MKSKAGIIPILALILLVVFMHSALALTGSMGNSRMVLRLEKGETVEKYILVKNVNDESIIVNLSVSGDLADYVKLKEDSFILEPGTEKEARFTIKAAKSGTTETKILVLFSPIEKGNGVGLASTVIVITDGDSDNSDEADEDESNNTGFSFNPKIPGIIEPGKEFSLSPMVILSISTILLAAVLVALSLYLKKMKNRKKVRRKIKSKKSAKKRS